MTSTILHGPWSQAPNLSAESKGSIHDDEQARSLGFQAALVGGSVLCSYMTTLLVERFGPAWYERGFFKTSFVGPVYETDEFRVVLEEREPGPGEAGLVAVRLEKRSGEPATAGYAGLAQSAATATPPWQRPGEAAAPALTLTDDPIPEEPIGTAMPPKALVVTPEESARRRAVAGDTSPWYADASPWGGPIVPSFMYLLVNLGNGVQRPASAQTSSARAGMNGTFQLLMTGPMFANQPYTLHSQLAEKGISGRTAFRTAEFRIVDADGRQVALARQKTRWFVRDAR